MKKHVALLLWLLACRLVWWGANDPRHQVREHGPEAWATSFSFVRPASAKTAVSSETWEVYDAGTAHAVTWTIYDTIGPDDGYAISKGEAGR